MQQPRTAWEKHAAKQSKKSTDSLEQSPATRMTKARLAVNENGHNVFERNTAPKAAVAPVVAPPSAPRTRSSRIVEDPKLTAARLAAEASRAASRKEKEEQARIPTYAAQTQEEINVMCKGWLDARRDTFHMSDWNIEMLDRAVRYLIVVGKGSWNFITLDTAFRFLSTNNHLEQQSRVRGSLPPVEFNPAPPQAEPANQRVIRRTEVSPEEIAALRHVPFEELQQASKMLNRKR